MLQNYRQKKTHKNIYFRNKNVFINTFFGYNITWTSVIARSCFSYQKVLSESVFVCCIIPCYSSLFLMFLCCFLPPSTLFSSFLTVLLSVCVLFLSGGASVILSLGFSTWCDTVTDTHRRPYRYSSIISLRILVVFKRMCLGRFTSLCACLVFSCAESQSVPLYLDVNTLSFYTELSLAQVGLLTSRILQHQSDFSRLLKCWNTTSE